MAADETRPDVLAACQASTPADGIMVGCEVEGAHERHRGAYVRDFDGVDVDVEVSWLTDEPAERDLSVPLDERAAFRARTIDAAALAVSSPAPAPAERPATATGPAGGNWRERAEQAEARLAEIEAHAPAIVDSLRHTLSYVEHVPHPSSQAAAEGYRSALAIIGTGEPHDG